MSIPICVLSSNNGIISNKSIQYYQNIAKYIDKKRNTLKKNSTQKQYDFESLVTLPSVENSKIIFEWFSNLSLNEKISICSIHNKWLATLINQLIIVYEYENSTTLIPLGEFKKFFYEKEIPSSNYYYDGNEFSNSYFDQPKGSDINFFTYYFRNIVCYENKISDKYNKYFLNNIKFFNYEEPNDTITISKHLLSKVDVFKKYFDLYSDNNFLKSSIEPDYNQNYKLYNFKFPIWLRNRQNFTIFEIIVGYIEQNILLNYEYYYYSKKIYDNKLMEKINEIEELNLKLENFLTQEFKDNESFYSTINNFQMKKRVQENPLLLSEFHFQRKMKYDIFGLINHTNNIILESITDRMIYLVIKKMDDWFKNSISELLYNICFVSSEDVASFNRPLYASTFNYLAQLFQNKNADELIEEMNNQIKKKKKHKKKKKKNNENKVNNINNEKNDNKNLNDLINIINKKDDKEMNIIEKNIIQEKETNIIQEKEINIIQEKNIINVDSENIIHNENEDNKKKKKIKNKKQKKEFFLYPTQQSKKNKKEDKENENEIEKHNLINKNTKEIEINKEKDHLTSNSSQTDNSTVETNEEYSNNNYKNNKIIYMNNNHYNYFYNPYYTSQILAFNIFKNICFFTPSENFLTKLTLELEMYNSNVNNNISKLNPIKGIYLEKLDKILKNNLTNFYNIEIINFGSYKTELSIEGSDIDILIKYKPIQNQNTFVSDLIGILYQNKQEFDYIKPITTASVPVIKLQFDISKLININKIDDYLDYDDLNKLKFDISFKEFDFYNNYFDKTIEFIKKSILDFPYVKDIVLLMKRYFKIIKLNKNYLGGLSSYSIFIMTLAFLKSKNYSKDISIGKQFYYFIEWYSLFNFTEYIINVTKEEPFIKIDESNNNDKITIIDPINQSNVSKSSFKIEEIKSAFIKVLNVIKIDAWKMEQQKEIDLNNINNPLKILNTIFQIK